MKNKVIDFFPTILSVVIPVISVNTFDIYTGLAVGVLGVLLLLFRNQKLIKRKKKEAIPEVLAIGYFLNFIEPLINRIVNKSKIMNTSKKTELAVNSERIEVKIIRSDLETLSQTKESINTMDEYSILDNSQNRGLVVRGKTINGELVIYDFPNTLFSLQDYFNAEFGMETKVKAEYVERFYSRVHKLIDERISTGFVELRKIEFINPKN